MANVVFFMLWEPGHLLSTFKLARDLIKAGHRVTYATIADVAGFVQSHGFEVLTVLQQVFPPDSFPAAQRLPQRKLRKRRRELFGANADGSIAARIWSIQPNIVLVDRLYADSYAVSLQRFGIPTLFIATSLPNEREGGLPPITTVLLPGGSALNRLRIEIAWCRIFLHRWLDYLRRIRPVLIPPRLCAQLPEIVVCLDEFDLERPRRPNRHYIGPSVDVERPYQPFPWHRLDGARPVIYCSLGTQAHRYRSRESLLRRVVAAIAERQTEYLVITGDDYTIDRLGHLPDNVIARRSVPQLDILQRASLAVVHGGLGTVKECILRGVPMVVFPQAYDQWGNAARVEYHGLGLRAIRRPSVRYVRCLIDTVLTDPAYRANVLRMQQTFRKAQVRSIGVEVVERYIRG
jgi:zeaxanthin glucosyltransferase